MEDFDATSPQPIPKEFYSEYEERPFRTCTRCGETLSDFIEGFQLAKVLKRGEVVFEYALCHPCHTGMVDEFSEESRRALEEFYTEQMTTGLGANTCTICQRDRSDLSEPEYTLGAVCQGSEMLEALMICAPCTEKSNSVISKKTQGIFGDFINDNFPGVPADALPDPSQLTFF